MVILMDTGNTLCDTTTTKCQLDSNVLFDKIKNNPFVPIEALNHP